MKGVSKSKNSVTSSDYNTCLEGGVIRGKNINLQLTSNQENQEEMVMSKVTVHKNALTGCNTKNITLNDSNSGACLPFYNLE
jgi:hypothetical protein